MKLSIKINMENAAFDENYRGSEVARILRELADKVEGRDLTSTGEVARPVDINGNVVGTCKVTR